MTNPLHASQTQHERPAFLELRAFFTCELRLDDIEARFGINAAASHCPHHLLLRNLQTLFGLESASMAPDRSDNVQKGRQ